VSAGSLHGAGTTGSTQYRRISLEAFFAVQRRRVAETLHNHTIRLRRRLLLHEYESGELIEEPREGRARMTARPSEPYNDRGRADLEASATHD
jgi:hypothetical protein